MSTQRSSPKTKPKKSNEKDTKFSVFRGQFFRELGLENQPGNFAKASPQSDGLLPFSSSAPFISHQNPFFKKRTIISSMKDDVFKKLQICMYKKVKSSHSSSVMSIDIDPTENRYLLSAGLDCQFSLYDIHDSAFHHPNPVTNKKSRRASTTHTFKPLINISKIQLEEQYQQEMELKREREMTNSSTYEAVNPIAPNPKDYHTSLISQISWYLADNGMFFTSSFDETIRVWDTNTMKAACIFELNGKVLSFAQQNLIESASNTSPIIAAAVDNSQKPLPKQLQQSQQNISAPAKKKFKVGHKSFLNEIALCDLRTGSSIHSLWGSKSPVWCVDFSPRDSRVLVSGDCEGKIRLWDIRKGGAWMAIFDQKNKRSKRRAEETELMQDDDDLEHANAADLNFLDDEIYEDEGVKRPKATPSLNSASKSFTLNHTPTMFQKPYKFEKPLHQRKKDAKHHTLGDPLAHANYIQNADPATGAFKSVLPEEPIAHGVHGHAQITCVKFTKDGRHVVSVGNDGSGVRLWDSLTGEFCDDVTYPAASGRGFNYLSQRTTTLCFSSDGNYMYLPINKEIGVYDVTSGELVNVMSGHFANVLGLCFNEREMELYSCGVDQQIFVWNYSKLNTNLGFEELLTNKNLSKYSKNLENDEEEANEEVANSEENAVADEDNWDTQASDIIPGQALF